VINANEAGDLDVSGDLLQAFASRGVRGGFIVVDEAAGKAP
jgi:hypothetical protein